jgi:hypothetical protein
MLTFIPAACQLNPIEFPWLKLTTNAETNQSCHWDEIVGENVQHNWCNLLIVNIIYATQGAEKEVEGDTLTA